MTSRTKHITAINAAADLLTTHHRAGTFERVDLALGATAGGGERVGGRSCDIADPTALAALAHDHAAADADAIDRKLRDAARLLGEVIDIAVRYAARPAHDGDRSRAGTPPAGCASCNRIDAWSPIERSVRLADETVVAVCSWCRNHVRSTGDLPALRKVEAHHRGERTSRAA